METKGTNTSNTEGVCEKIFNALAFRRNSYESHNHVSANSISPPAKLPQHQPEKVHGRQHMGPDVVPSKVDPSPPKEKEKTTRLVPIEDKRQLETTTTKLDRAPPHALVLSQAKPNNKVSSVTPSESVVRQGKAKGAPKTELQRTASAEGGGGKKGGLGNINERASDYIARAKIKIMSTASFGGGRITSFK